MRYEYKVVPFMGVAKSGDQADKIATQLQRIINTNAGAGWEFAQLADVRIEIKPGCFSAFFGGDSSYTVFDQIIFKRAI